MGAFSGARTRRRLLIGAAAVVAVGVAGFGIREYRLIPPDYSGGRLSVAEAHAAARAGDVVLVDIRTPREWHQTGLGEGAHPIDMRRADFVSALTELAGPDRTRPIALICARGVRSARLSLALTEAGFTDIIDVPEGMLGSRAGPGWLAEGLPVEIYTEEGG